jgi:hypothetical protein
MLCQVGIALNLPSIDPCLFQSERGIIPDGNNSSFMLIIAVCPTAFAATRVEEIKPLRGLTYNRTVTLMKSMSVIALIVNPR